MTLPSTSFGPKQAREKGNHCKKRKAKENKEREKNSKFESHRSLSGPQATSKF